MLNEPLTAEWRKAGADVEVIGSMDATTARVTACVMAIGGWGEASLQGQSTPTGRSVCLVCACVHSRSVIHVKSGINFRVLSASNILLCLGAFPFPPQDLSV